MEATSLVGINEQNSLQNQYWGKKITRDQRFVPARAEEPYPLESPESLPPQLFPTGLAVRELGWHPTDFR